MLSPGIYKLSVDGIEVAARRLDQSVDNFYVGESCLACPEGSRTLKVLVRSCVPFLWTIKEATDGLILLGDNAENFEPEHFDYVNDGTCQHHGSPVHTYWEETCIGIGMLDSGCFEFVLGTHPRWQTAQPNASEAVLVHAPHNTVTVLLVGDEQILVDRALVGSLEAGPLSEVHYRFGGGCEV